MSAAEVATRFWQKVDRKGDDECWIWLGARHQAGYGKFWAGAAARTRYVVASRFSYELHFGPIADGLVVCHSCDNPPCCNPAHLWLGTKSDNSRDAFTKGRMAPPHNTGACHYAAKLDDDKAREIRDRYEPGVVTRAMLAQEFGVSVGTIERVVYGRSCWR